MERIQKEDHRKRTQVKEDGGSSRDCISLLAFVLSISCIFNSSLVLNDEYFNEAILA